MRVDGRLARLDGRLPIGRRELEAFELERGGDDAPHEGPLPERPRALPGSGRHEGLDDGLAGRHDAAEPLDRDRGVALRPGAQLEVVAAGPLPHLVCIESMPVRTLARGQQEQDRAAGTARAVAGPWLPRLDIPATLRVRPHPQAVRHVASGGHRFRVSAAATAKPLAVSRPTSLFFSAWADGRSSEASSVRMAPAANASMKAMTSPGAPANRP